MTDRIVVTGIRGTGYHGVFEHERRDGGHVGRHRAGDL